jgi:hypothetical protein
MFSMPLDHTQWASNPKCGMFATPGIIVQLRISGIIYYRFAYVCVKIIPTNPVWKKPNVLLGVDRTCYTSI